MKQISIIYKKEMKEVLRDRRTLTYMVLLPLVGFPLIFGYLFQALNDTRAKAETEVLKVGVVNGAQMPDLVAVFDKRADYETTDLSGVDEIKQAIADRSIKIAMVFTEDAGQVFAEGGQVGLFLYYHDTQTGSICKRRVQTVLDQFNDKQRKKMLRSAGIRSRDAVVAIKEPIALVSYQIASAREELGAQVGGLLPYFFIILCFMGATHPAVDLGAGEKERGTLETLLLTPVPRLYLVLGKFLVVFTSGIVSALLCLVGMSSMIMLKGGTASSDLELVLKTLGQQDLMLMGLMLIPLAAIFASILLSISIYARTQKEAGSTITPLNFLVIIPAMVATIPGIELNGTMAMIPVCNVALAIKEIAKGTMDWGLLGIILGSTALLAVGMLVFCVKWFQKESVLFRS